MIERADYLIKTLNLLNHPEGGYYKEVYRSKGFTEMTFGDSDEKVSRSFATSIYFLLASESFSAFHRIRQDEIWHFYEGSPIELFTLNPSGKLSRIVIGANIEKGEYRQYVVPAGDWFASRVLEKNNYSLVACVVAPGFDFKDFELGNREDLIRKFPEHRKVIQELTRL